MPAAHFFANNLEEIGLDPQKVQALFERAAREVHEGLLPASQVAIARNGKLGAMQTFGTAVQGGVEKPATNDTQFVIMSSTKAFAAASAWLLMQEGKLRPEDRIVDFVPEFGTNGKDVVTVEQCLVHTSAIPYAPHWQKEWADKKRRFERFAQWRLDHTPGEKFVYHISANFWPIADIVERESGQSFSDFVRTRIAEPLGLPDLRVGISAALNDRVADIEWVGERMTAEDYAKAGMKPPRTTAAISDDGVMELNELATRLAGSPSAGGITTAGDIALFYQALLNDGRSHDGKQIWQPEMLREARRVRTGNLTDPYLGHLALRALGIAIAGGDGKANLRAFGKTNSPEAFGHPGFGGQSGWADPATGISFGYLTNGFDRNDLREGRRRVALSSLAASCAA
ncbi:MAG: beta-lactamase family protein [Deltaproteobacteria bacterium]|nr:beta-lactamase family protein [Deltaproteobacteria bacterium]